MRSPLPEYLRSISNCLPIQPEKPGLHLPKGRLAYTRRAENLGDLATHVSARNGSAWQSMGSKVLVEPRQASANGAGAPGVECLEGLRGRYRRQPICGSISWLEKVACMRDVERT